MPINLGWIFNALRNNKCSFFISIAQLIQAPFCIHSEQLSSDQTRQYAVELFQRVIFDQQLTFAAFILDADLEP